MDDKDKIVQKWKKLQEIILNEKFLTDALFKSKNNDYNDIKKLIWDLSDTKNKLRQTLFRNNNKNNNNENDVIISEEYEEKNIFLSEDDELNKEIKSFLFFLRKNIDYILAIISIIYEENDDTKELEINSFIELLLNNFYDEFPIKKKINKNIMIIIYKFFEKEICKMDNAMSDSFINSNIFFDKFLNSFLIKEEFLFYLEKILNPLVSLIEKEIEEKSTINLSLIEIKNKINDKNNSNKDDNDSVSRIKKNLRENNLNMEEIDKTELIYYIWKNHEQFFNDLTMDNIIKKLKNEKNDELKRIIYRNGFERNVTGYNRNKDFLSNKRIIDVLNTEYFDKNLEFIVKEYKSNYLFIHQRIDSFLLELIGKVNLIPKTIRYICKIIFLLISAKFPDLPLYIKNSFIGNFFFGHFIFPCLLFENKFIFNNKIISYETRRCIGEIISILSYANNCILFENYINTEKTVFNNYIIEIIPILDKFYKACIGIKLPAIIDELVNLKIKEIKLNKNIKRNLRKKKFNVSNPVNQKNDLIVSEIIKRKSTKNIFSQKNLFWKFKYICFSYENLLYILSLINKYKSNFLNLPKYDIFNNMFQSLKNKKVEIEILISKNKNKEKFYIIYEEPNSDFIKFFHNNKKSNINPFLQNPDISNEMKLNHIKYSIKLLLQELNSVNKLNSNENFFKSLLFQAFQNDNFSFLVTNKNKNVPLYWFAKYIKDNLKLLEEKYIENDFKELFEELYKDELNNLNILNKYWDKIIIKNEEDKKILENYIIQLKSKLNNIQNAYYINQAEKIIFFNKIEVFITINTKKKKLKKETENIQAIKIDYNKTNNENEKKINTIEEFINLFSPNFSFSSCEQKQKPYDLLISDIIEGENKNQIYEVILIYLSMIKKFIRNNYSFMDKNEIDATITIIKDYILESLYKLVFPTNPTENDLFFYQKTKELDWITIQNFGIKDIELYQIYYPEMIMNKFEESKSLNEKIKYIKYIHKYINDIFKFNTGKDEIGQDEATPFIQYLIIKCQPKRIVSNINFIKNFLSEVELLGDKGFFISQIDSAIIFVLSINHTTLDMNEEEFNKKVANSKIKNNIK